LTPASSAPTPAPILAGQPLWMRDTADERGWVRRCAAADERGGFVAVVVNGRTVEKPRHRVRTEDEHQALAGLAPSELRRRADRKRREREREKAAKAQAAATKGWAA
jgi:hypothetical protein